MAKDDDPKASRLLRYIENPEQLLAMLLIGTNIATVAGTIAITQVFEEFVALDGSLVEILTALTVTPLLLIFAEIVPKSVFRKHPNRLTLALLPVIQFFYWILWPVSKSVAWLTRILFRADKAQACLSSVMTTLEDVRVLVDESADQGTIEPEEQRMIHSVIDMQSMLAKDIMVPRIDIVALPDTTTRAELLELFKTTGKTRILIFHKTVDRIMGVATAHDVMIDTEPDDADISRFVRDVMHVPDTITLDDAFERMKNEKQHIVIVVDEYGGTDGLITLEDLLEVIFGEIQDEHDKERKAIHRVGANAYVIDARMELSEAAEVMGIEIEDSEVATVGGWVMSAADRIPAQGEIVELGPYRMTVLEGSKSQVSLIRLEILQEQRGTNGPEKETKE